MDVRGPGGGKSRLEVHRMVHDLIRKRGSVDAASVLNEILVAELRSRPPRRRKVSRRTLIHLFRATTVPVQIIGDIQISSEISLPKPQTEYKPPSTIPPLLALLHTLQNQRHPRPKEIYKALIRQCVAQDLFDVAAGVYVGMVEEWITEGRIAEGANAQHFYDGGGPPREGREELELEMEMLKTWWKGIRSWALPGEVLSPHDRLDLWHPRKLALSEKLRRFPLPNPTSPPTLVPFPDEGVLRLVIKDLDLNLKPDQSNLRRFQASMRACATLSNTILSRTLPGFSRQTLVETLGQTPFHPPVFPEGFDPQAIRPNRQWAYTAYTQIHLALQSLLFQPSGDPKQLAYLRRLSEAEITGECLPSKPPSFLSYMTGPMSFKASLALIRYGFRKLRSFSSVYSPLAYVAQRFGYPIRIRLLNTVLRGAIAHSKFPEASKVLNNLFRSPLALTNRNAENTLSTIQRVVAALKENPHGRHELPDVESCIALIDFLRATEQYDVLRTLTYALLPDSRGRDRKSGPGSQSLMLERITSISSIKKEWNSWTHPNDKDALSIFSALLRGLADAGDVVLAQKVFHTAMRFSIGRIRKAESTDQEAEYRHPRLSIQSFTAMLDVWKNERRRASTISSSNRSRSLPPISQLRGWSVPEYCGSLSREDAATAMILHTYDTARQSWLAFLNESKADRLQDQTIQRSILPDAYFFNTMLAACEHIWGDNIFLRPQDVTDSNGRMVLEPLGHRQWARLETLVKDMRQFNIPVPEMVELRLSLPSTDREGAVSLRDHPGVAKRYRSLTNRLSARKQREQELADQGLREGMGRTYNRGDAADLWEWQVDVGRGNPTVMWRSAKQA